MFLHPMDTIRDFTPDVEVVSVDEAYADVTGFNKLHKIVEQYFRNISNFATR